MTVNTEQTVSIQDLMLSKETATVAFAEDELNILRLALYGNLDMSHTPTLRRIERLHATLGTALEVIRLRKEADKIQEALVEPS